MAKIPLVYHSRNSIHILFRQMNDWKYGIRMSWILTTHIRILHLRKVILLKLVRRQKCAFKIGTQRIASLSSILLFHSSYLPFLIFFFPLNIQCHQYQQHFSFSFQNVILHIMQIQIKKKQVQSSYMFDHSF